jgi:hypothetical protein
VLRSAVVAGLVVLDVALWAIAGRLDVAVHALLSEQQAAGTWPSAGLPHEWIWWVIVGAAIVLTIGLMFVVVRTRPQPRRPVPWHFVVIAVATPLAFSVWAGWDLVSVVGDGWHSAETLHDTLLPPLLGVLVLWLLVETGAIYGVTVRQAWNLAPIFRVHIFLLGLLIVGAFLFPMTSGQAIDLMRAWTDAGWRLPAAALASALVLGEMMRESGIRLSAASLAIRNPPAATFHVFRLVTIMPAGILFVGAVIAATDPLLLESISDGGVFRAFLAAVIGSVVMVALVTTVIAPPPRQAPAPPSGNWLGLLGIAAPAIGFGVGIAFAAFTMWTSVGMILVMLVFVGGQWWYDRLDAPTRGALPLTLAGGLSAGVGFAVYWNPIHYPRQLGMIAVAFAFAAGLLGVLHGLALGAEALYYSRRSPPFRIPVVSLLVVWFGLATQCAPQSQHQARVDHVKGLGIPTTLDVATEQWLSDEYEAIRSTGRTPGYLPLLLVADSGGGSKSAYWTDLVLDCLISGGHMTTPSKPMRECSRTPRLPTPTIVRRERGLFLTSSVSGGSVGVSRYVSEIRDVASGKRWVDRMGALPRPAGHVLRMARFASLDRRLRPDEVRDGARRQLPLRPRSGCDRGGCDRRAAVGPRPLCEDQRRRALAALALDDRSAPHNSAHDLQHRGERRKGPRPRFTGRPVATDGAR